MVYLHYIQSMWTIAFLLASVTDAYIHTAKPIVKCYQCDSQTIGQEDCKNNTVPKKYEFNVPIIRGAYGRPLCYRIWTDDKTNVERGWTAELIGGPHWLSNDFKGCKKFYDGNSKKDRTICLCYEDLCNNNQPLDFETGYFGDRYEGETNLAWYAAAVMFAVFLVYIGVSLYFNLRSCTGTHYRQKRLRDIELIKAKRWTRHQWNLPEFRPKNRI